MPITSATDGTNLKSVNTGLENVICIDLIPVGRGNFHCYRAGEFVAKDELSACRVLLGQGFTGSIETWRKGDSYPSMRIVIAAGAKLAISETDKHGPRFVPFRPYPTDKRLPVNRQSFQADLGAGVMHPSGSGELPSVIVAARHRKQNSKGRTPRAV